MNSTPISDNISIDKLHFNSGNPRFSEVSDRSSDEIILKLMIENENITSLMRSIAISGFSEAEPLLVVSMPKITTDYTVIEGNRRLAAAKLLKNPKLAKAKATSIAEIARSAPEAHVPSKLPVLKYGEEKDILPYLGFRHIAGVRPWGALEKARYLKRLYDGYIKSNESATGSDVADFIKSTTDQGKIVMRKNLACLKLFDTAISEKFWGAQGISAGDVKFSIIQTAFNHKPIVTFLGLSKSTDISLSNLDTDNARMFFEWCFKEDEALRITRLGESRNLARLRNIVGNERALSAFIDGMHIEDADKLVDDPIAYTRSNIIDATAAIDNAIVASRDVDNVTVFHPEFEKLLEKIDAFGKAISAKGKA